ncbi:DALR anticodon-binding domain-containing protein, partial [Porphyromonas loveana]
MRKAEAAGYNIPATLPTDLQLSEKEEALVQKLNEYADVVAEAGRTYSPALIANYVYDLVKEYNQFYHDFSVLKEENEQLRAFRLALSEVIARTMRTGFSLLGIEMPERM